MNTTQLPLFEQKSPNNETQDALAPLLELMSIIYAPVYLTPLMECTKKLDIRHESGSYYTSKTLKADLAKLIKQKKVMSEKKTYFCNPKIVETITRQSVVNNTFDKIVKVIIKIIPLSNSWGNTYASNYDQAMRELRFNLYAQNDQSVLEILEQCRIYYERDRKPTRPLPQILFNPYDPYWITQLSPLLLSETLIECVSAAIYETKDYEFFFSWVFDAMENKNLILDPSGCYLICIKLLLQGEFEKINQLLPSTDDYHRSMLVGCLCFMKGDNDKAIAEFESALQYLKKQTKKRKIFIDGFAGIFFILSLFRRNDTNDHNSIKTYCKIHLSSAEHSNHNIHVLLSILVDYLAGDKSTLDYVKTLNLKTFSSTMQSFFFVLILYWMDKNEARKHQKALAKKIPTLKNNHFSWFQSECLELISRLEPKDGKKSANEAARIRQDLSFVTMIDTIKLKEPWERTLDAIANIQVLEKKSSATANARLIWVLSIRDIYVTNVVPKEQKINAKGNWTSGRNIALKRLSENPLGFPYLTEKDRTAMNTIDILRDYYGSRHYQFDLDKLIPVLIDHPHLFLNDDTMSHITLTKGNAVIAIEETKNELTIKMDPELDDENSFSLKKESETRWAVVEPTKNQRELYNLIGDGLTIPKDGKDKVLASMSSVASIVNVHSDIGGEMIAAKKVDSDSTIHLLLSPLDEGLKIEAKTQNFGTKGPYYFPANGGKTIMAEVEGKQLQTTRDFDLEQNNIQQLLDRCPTLSAQPNLDSTWTTFDPESCLEILLELKEQDTATVSWPEGEKFKINQSVSLSNFKLTIKKHNDWFAATGELALDDGEVISMKRLMALSKTMKGRFISIADGQYIALSNVFKNRIQDLQSLGDEKEDSVLLHPLAAVLLDDMSAEVGSLKSDKNWKSYITRYHEAMALEPSVSSTLQTELRDYQVVGFQWLARLAHWGVGACLADDMGLGKTVQAIALLLHRATVGPALVIAPTSVAMNWMDEIQRFAPTLNVIDYRDCDRENTMQNLNEFDVLICSYGLLQNNIEQMCHISPWATIILDEAQAIKNAATKRSQSVMSLEGSFKVILTGTPIENHLGELWNLFRFINPGLLGSAEKFNLRYANPIIKNDAINAKQSLKTLIQPYILRRTKTQVLKELPSRTEILLQVEMSQEESTLYEAIRRDAVDKFANTNDPKGNESKNNESKGSKHLQILAEITRLRRVCCNPSLVLKTGAPASSKLALFTTVVTELLDNKHKALVFSQFVDHLAIIQDKLKSLGISYQYLDGSTSAKERKKRVTEFQSGIGDIFLISLKAGGVGLNLTAADYVIHMDPWWNPAVEDQASDRAHRIGQTRPVTVYRMVTTNTIEEKIVALHKSKRDLADNLLAGSDVAGKVNMEELLELLRGN